MAAEETRIAALVFIDIGFDLLDWPSRQEIRLLLRRLTHYSLFDAACFRLVRQNSPSVTMPGSDAPKSAFTALCCIFFAAKGGPVLIRLALLCLVVSGLLANSNAQSGDWKQLFNGKDLVGWKHVGPGEMTVQDGVIKTSGGMGLLYWAGGQLGDCTIRVVFKMEHENDNSGVYIRIPLEPREAWMPVNYGYEIQIDNKPDDYHSTGVVYSFSKAMARPGRPGPEWNTMEITLDGPHTRVVLNGVKVTEFTEGDPVPPKKFDFEPERGPRPQEGYIGLQNHSDNDIVFFKEIGLRMLNK